MGRICLECGSLEWKEDIAGVTYTYTVNERGYTEEIDRDSYGDCVRVYCAECDEDATMDLWELEEGLRKLVLSFSNAEDRIQALKEAGVIKEEED